MNQLMMTVCAMRLDKTVQLEAFVRAVQDIQRDTRIDTYRELRRYLEDNGPEALAKLLADLVEGRGWVMTAKVTP